MRELNRFFCGILYVFILAGLGSAQVDIYDSGGPLMPEQAAYDVRFYDLNLNVSPSDSSIAGSVGIRADIIYNITRPTFTASKYRRLQQRIELFS